MKKILFLFSLVGFVINCSPSKQLKRLERNHPEFFIQDSTIKTIRDTSKAININLKSRLDTIGKKQVDSLIGMYRDAINDLSTIKTIGDSSYKALTDSLRRKANKDIWKYISTYKFLKDTVIKIQGDVTVKAWQDGPDLKMSIQKPESVKTHTVIESSVSINKCPECETKWWDVGCRWLCLFLLILVLIYEFGKEKK